ncbi:hypothetical protein [Celeribacter arenosi]|uniref:Gcp-like domain-containing protein n=1 Tax=Celeribacter arenosi TaxID=792649 RepID=A0ABP7JS27_9RHOB
MSALTLLLQVSNGAPILALAEGENIRFDTRSDPAFEDNRDYRAMLEAGLRTLGAAVGDLEILASDIGPGGLGATRTGAAFVNALGYALSKPVIGLPAFELLGRTVWTGKGPVAILRKAARPFVHFGIFENNELVRYEYCERDTALDAVKNLSNVDIAGNVPLDGYPAPLTNVADMGVMAKMAMHAPGLPSDARARPIVETLQ